MMKPIKDMDMGTFFHLEDKEEGLFLKVWGLDWEQNQYVNVTGSYVCEINNDVMGEEELGLRPYSQ